MNLVEQVKADLQEHIETRGHAPCKLTYAGLADHYGVSFTPIRAAVAQLVEDGYLTLKDNRRLEVGSKLPRRGKRPNRRRKPVVSQEEQIRKHIIFLGLQGKSIFVREEALAKEFGIGRTALRPILGRLSGLAMIVHEPRRGWRVRSFDIADLCSFLEAREALELKALDLAFDRLDPARLEELLEENRQGIMGETGNEANNLHGYWIGVANNYYISQFFAQQGAYYRTLLDYAAPAIQQTSEVSQQHCEILEALLNKDLDRAKSILSVHIQSQKPIMKDLIHEIRS